MTTDHNGNGADLANSNGKGPARVVVAVPTDGRIHARTLESIRAMLAATRLTEAVEFWWYSDIPHDRCRNGLVRRFLTERGWTHLLFVDNDMVVPADGLDLLLRMARPLACGPAPLLMRRPNPPRDTIAFGVTTNIMFFERERLRGSAVDLQDASERYLVVDPDEFPDRPFECDASGLSFVLIERRVLETMEAPWFRFIGDEPGARLGEDVYFFRKARRHGFQLGVHPAAMCDHLKHVDLTHLDRLFSDDPPVPAWRPTIPDQIPSTLVVAAAPHGWLKSPTAGVLAEWSSRWGDRVHTHTIDAASAAELLSALAIDPIVHEVETTHILLLGPDVVPDADTLPILAGVGQPVVSAMTRTVIDGAIRWAFWLREPGASHAHAPQNLNLADLNRPFEVVGVDPSVLLVERWALTPLVETTARARRLPRNGSAAPQEWLQEWEDLTGYLPYVAPYLVRRDAQTGLLGLLEMKMRFRAQLRPAPRRAATQEREPQPV